MRAKNTQSLLGQALFGATLALGSMLALSAHAAAPGIAGTSGAPVFNLNAAAMRITQPNGKSLYSWGYGCTSTAGNSFAPAMRGATCPTAQLPGPTLIVTEGDTVTGNPPNGLPAAPGNTSLPFPGFQAATQGAAPGCRTRKAPSLATSL